ncbi:MAG: FTR1 family iron permease [Azoarcus sp.]|jgi:high-affinity iron transporter|nr:FTR1 family iron permease [Azoarcus sp.]
MSSLRRASRLVPFLLLLFVLVAPAHAAPDGAAVIAGIIERGEAAVAAYDPAQSLVTASEFSALYFERFEALELDLGLRDAALKNELEVLFGALNGSAMRGVPRAQLQSAWRELKTKLEQAQRHYGEGAAVDDSTDTFLKAVLILLREGAEAMLVVGALVAYLRRAGAADKAWVIHAGVAAAIVLSLLTGWALDSLLQGIGAPLAVVEGLTLLAASAMLFYVSCWLFTKRKGGRWEEWIARQMERTLGTGSLLALAVTAGLAVYREGAETVLFYEALAAGAPGESGAIRAGFALAVLLLVALYFLMRKAALTLPFRFFFSTTSVLLYSLAVVFLGQAIVELQAAGWIASIYLPGFPQISWLGIAPSAQSLGAQALLLLPPLTWLAYRAALTLKKEKP